MQKVTICQGQISWGFQKKKLETSSHSNSAKLRVDNYKLSIFDTTEMENESEAKLWNKGANEIDTDK